MLGFAAQHPTVSCGTERSHLPPLHDARVTKSCPDMADCHQTPLPAVHSNNKIILYQYLTFAIPDPHPSNSAGYELTSVDVQLGDSVPSAGDIVVEILSHSGGPGSTLATLTNPTTLTKQSANTFTVPASDQLTLDAETTYYVLIYHADDDDVGSTVTAGILIDRTYSKSEDSGAATGWSIGNRRYYRVRYGDSWSVNIIRFAKIAIRGTRLLSDDATLSGLSLSHGSITVPLNRAFDAATTQYTASVAYGVSSLTVKPTTNEMNATVGYFDASDTDLDDADANTPDHQVNLEEGSNTLKVKVTADDGNTTETYTVVVTRERPTVPEAPEGLGATAVSPTRIYLYWTAPSNFVNSAITGYEYRVSSDDGHTWFRAWRDIQGAGNRADITEHTVHWLDSANEYTFQVRAENALGGGLSASVKARPGKPAVSRPTLTIENVTGEDNVIAGKRDATRPVQQGSLVNGVFVGNGTYHDSCHEDAIAHYRIRATGGDHLWRPGSRFQGVSVGVEYRRAGRNGERSHAGVSSSVTDLVGRIAGSIVPGNRHWDQKTCIATQGADRRPLIVRLVPGEGYFVGRPRAICIRVDREDNGTVDTGTPCPNVLEENAADPLPVMAVSDASANEANGSIGFLVSLDKPAAGTVTVDYRTENVTATAPGDYTQTSGTLTFEPGETQEMVTVLIIDDTVTDNGETFKLVLSNVSGAKLGDAEAVGTILNTETPILSGFTLVNAETGSDVGAIDDGGVLTLDDPANGSYGLVAAVASDAGVGSVRLALTGAKTVTATDDAAPFSLYGDEDGTVTGAGLPAGSYTLSATAYAEAAGGGAALGTLAVSFRVAASEPVDADALTASFTGVPAEHGGGGESNRFSFDLAFSENPKASYITLRDHSFTVTGGDVKTAKRKTRGSNRHWTITVEPDGWGDVSLILPGGRACTATGAVCTADGKVLANTAVAVVPGPLALSVTDARIDEAPNAVLAFQVTLNRAATGTVTVDYTTADGTAAAGADYTGTSGTLTFDPGETEKTVNVPVLDDAHDDDEETLTLTLSNASGARIRDGEATGTIENSDPIPQAWLARFGRTVAGHVVDAIGDRLTAPPGGGSHVALGGHAIPLDGAGAPRGAVPRGWDPAGEQGADADAAADGSAWEPWRRAAGPAGDVRDPGRPVFGDGLFGDALFGDGRRDGGAAGSLGMTERELLLGSSFVLAFGGAGEGASASGTAWTAWGRAAASGFDGEADGLTVDGDVTTFTFGADAARGRWLTGLGLAHSTGEGGYRDHADEDGHAGQAAGRIESSLTSLHPYVRFEASERLSLWGILGYGAGDLTLTPEGADGEADPAITTDTSMWMAAAGARGVLVAAADAGGFELAARGDAQIVRMRSGAASGGGGRLAASEARTSRVRLMLEGSQRIELAGGQTLTPSLEVGLRHDGGDAETGAGIEVGGGIAWSDPEFGVSAEAKAHGLLAHEDAGYSEWGMSGALRIDPGAEGRGLSLGLTSALGTESGAAERLWSLADARGLAPEGAAAELPARLGAELGYGFAVLDGRGVATPRAGWSRGESGDRLRLGQRLRLGASEWSVEGEFGRDGRSYRAGWGWRPDDALGLSLGATRREAADEPAEHQIGFRLQARF